MMSEPCDCDWCGKCRDQQSRQRELEERSDYE
jgi:hypothetical protein